MAQPLEIKAYRTNIEVNLEGTKINKLPVLAYKYKNEFPLLYIPISFLPSLKIEVLSKDNKLFLRSNNIPNENKILINQINLLKQQNISLVETNQNLTNRINNLNDTINKLKREIDRLKSFPKDIPYETEFDHIFNNNPEFFIYYGKKNFTDAIEQNEQIKKLINYMEANGLRVNWTYYPAANQIYIYLSFINQRLGLNDFDSDKTNNLLGNAYDNLKEKFIDIINDKSIRLEMSVVFLETIEGYEVQRSIFVNEINVNELKENTSKN